MTGAVTIFLLVSYPFKKYLGNICKLLQIRDFLCYSIICVEILRMWRNWYTRTLEVRVGIALASSSLAIRIFNLQVTYF